MKFDEKTNEFTLSSGLKFYAFCGLLNPFPGNDEPYGLAEGYDSVVHLGEIENAPANEYCPRLLTEEERKEIAKYMIDQWNKWLSGTLLEEVKNE